jgi:hypothetical protein
MIKHFSCGYSLKEPENIDKELLRRWFAERCDPYNDPTLPTAPQELVQELARRYIMSYELMLGSTFEEAIAPFQEVKPNDAVKAFFQNKLI